MEAKASTILFISLFPVLIIELGTKKVLGEELTQKNKFKDLPWIT